MEFWEELCDKYVSQLLADGQHHKAASYLLTNNKVYDAIRLLKDHGFYKYMTTFLYSLLVFYN